MNGWQRLWVVVCIAIGISLMIISERFVPTKEGITKDYNELLTFEDKLINELKDKQPDNAVFNEAFYGPKALQEREQRKLEIQASFKSDLDSLWLDKLKIRGKIAAAWLIICVGLYFLGMVGGWVLQGFRPKRA